MNSNRQRPDRPKIHGSILFLLLMLAKCRSLLRIGPCGWNAAAEHDFLHEKPSRVLGHQDNEEHQMEGGYRLDLLWESGRRRWKGVCGHEQRQPQNSEIKGDKGILMSSESRTASFSGRAVSDKLESGKAPTTGPSRASAPLRRWMESGSTTLPTGANWHAWTQKDFWTARTTAPISMKSTAGPTDADIIWKLDMMKELRVLQHNMANSSPIVWEDLVFLETSNGLDDSHEKVPSPSAPSFLGQQEYWQGGLAR